MNTVFIVDTYNPSLSHNENVRYTFKLNHHDYCIKEVPLNWGLPVLPIQLTDDAPEPENFYLYNTFEEAMAYVKKIKEYNR